MLQHNGMLILLIFLSIFSTRAKDIIKFNHPDFLDGVNLKAVAEAVKKYNPDAYLSITELVPKYGYNIETHKVVTEDEYILEMHRITGPKNNSDPKGKPAVFLMHGLFMSSTDWIVSGPGRALGYILSDAGYDVWLGNARGNTFGKKHIKYPVNTKKFWTFSWHEIGRYDLPAMIDVILSKTGHKNVTYIGHSQGTTSFFVMASTLPEYNYKIKTMHALAPVAYCGHMISPIFRFLSLIVKKVQKVMEFFGHYEVTLSPQFYKKFTSKLCDTDSALQPVCSNLLFMFAGFSQSQMNLTELPVQLGHTPAGASIFQLMHYAQLINNKNYFRHFDYGIVGNLKNYKQISPPQYDLSLVTTPTIFYYTYNDWLAHVKDVDRAYSELKNPVARIRIPLKDFNHLDFLWGTDARSLLYEKILSFLSRYEKNLNY